MLTVLVYSIVFIKKKFSICRIILKVLTHTALICVSLKKNCKEKKNIKKVARESIFYCTNTNCNSSLLSLNYILKV